MSKDDLLTINEAAKWATQFRGRRTAPHNIAYLINYAKIHTFDKNGNLRNGLNGEARISLSELKNYFDNNSKEKQWKEVLGSQLNWSLSFDKVTEAESTKHVHRLHQYKGKFIPQLVEYFLDEHLNEFKKQVFFQPGDIILDPFVGSGTTLVECLELGLNSIGIDISKFNCMISEVKTRKYNLDYVTKTLRASLKRTINYSHGTLSYDVDEEILDQMIARLNHRYFPNPRFKFLIARLRAFQATLEKEAKSLIVNNEAQFNKIQQLILDHQDEKNDIEIEVSSFIKDADLPISFEITPVNMGCLSGNFSERYSEKILEILETQICRQNKLVDRVYSSSLNSPFISAWFSERQKLEMAHYLEQIEQEKDESVKNLMRVVLSRTIRSCRATTHSDLATLVEPQIEPYYCTKHYKICKPVTSIIGHLKRYTEDTIARLCEFDRLRKDVFCEVIAGDSRNLDIFSYIKTKNASFYDIMKEKKIDGIFTSPPYVGNIDYHEQHAYSYELFNIERQDELEIGRQSLGTGLQAQVDYVNQISEVLLNAKKFLKPYAPIFIVANDSRGLYRKIAKKASLQIINEFHRPVLNRTERDKQPYAETIFQMT
jgi:hypothetical protein